MKNSKMNFGCVSDIIDEASMQKIQSSSFPKVVIRKIIWQVPNNQFQNRRKFSDVEQDQFLKDKDISVENLRNQANENIEASELKKYDNSSASVECDGEHKDFFFSCQNCDFKSRYKSNDGYFELVHECTAFKCLVCSIVFNRETDIEKHSATHLSESASSSSKLLFEKESVKSSSRFKSSQEIKCSVCSFECKDKTTFENHMMIHSNDVQQSRNILTSGNKEPNIQILQIKRELIENENFKCIYCNFEVNNKDDLIDHLTLHEEKYMTCSKCGFETNSSEWLGRHLVIHEPIRNKCPKCNFESEEKEILGQHLLTHECVFIQCPDCSFICSCKTNFNIHYFNFHLLNHEPALFQCSKCDMLINQKLDFENHLSKHSELYHQSKSNKKKLDLHSRKQETNIFKCSKCQFEGSNEEDLGDHLLQHYQGEIFECTECFFVTSVESELKVHLKTHFYQCKMCDFTTISVLGRKVKHECVKKCSVCDFTTKDTDSFYRHERKHKSLFKYKCSGCKYMTNDKSSFDEHKTRHPETFICPHCPFKCEKLEQYRMHKYIHKEKKYKCDKCDFRACLESILKMHDYKTHSTSKAYKCLECNREWRARNAYRTHMLRHKGIYKFHCDLCQFKTLTKKGLRLHFQTHSETKGFSCSQCNFSTKSAMSLRSHMKIHSDKKRYKCDKCQYETNYQHNFKTHVLKHTNVRLFNCGQCEYTSNYKFCIERHVQLTHQKDANEEEGSKANGNSESGEKESSTKELYKCPQCVYTTSYIGNLRVHKMTSHSKKEEYSCPHCEFSTTSKDSFDLHSVDHLEVLKCFYCDFASDSKPELREHLLQHQQPSGKKLQCDECSVICTTRVGLNQHKKTHLKTKEWKCSICKYATNFKGNLTKHLKLKH